MFTAKGLALIFLALVVVATGVMMFDATVGTRKGKNPVPPASAATLDQRSALAAYYAGQTNCPKIKIDPELLKQFPQLPAVLATLKYSLAMGNVLPNVKSEPNLQGIDPQVLKDRRERLLKLLDDPSLSLVYALPKDGDAGMKVIADQFVKYRGDPRIRESTNKSVTCG